MKLTAENLKAHGIVERVFAEPEEYIVQNMDVVIMQMDEAIEDMSVSEICNMEQSKSLLYIIRKRCILQAMFMDEQIL